MSPHIYTEGLPEEQTPVPSWGALPLNLYLLVTPHLMFHALSRNNGILLTRTRPPNELPDQRRKRLVRQWLNLGTMGREPYYSRTRTESQTYAPAQPPTAPRLATPLRRRL
ncbi:hypothetical protein N7524_002455 [Penicillium chrysogenum]|nr:hypothetical protein N7524_002455 [Penicillium chrysogenum]